MRSSDTPLQSTEPSYLQSVRNTIASFIPVKFAVAVSEKYRGNVTDKGVFKFFQDEIRSSLDLSGSTSEFTTHFLSEYLNQTLIAQSNTGELLALRDKMESDLNQGYDPSLPEAERSRYKSRAFKRIMLKLGPHGIKHIQSLRPTDPNSWMADAIGSAQSDLPGVSILEFKELLKKAFRAQGSHEYADNFDKYIKVKKILGAGTLGYAALLEYRQSPVSTVREIVAKILRAHIVEKFHQDYACLSRALDIVLAEGKGTAKQVESFRHLNKMKLEEELKEANANIEVAQLEKKIYEGPGVTTVSGILELSGKAKDVVFMDKAEGMELHKLLKNARKAIARTEPEFAEEKEVALKEIFDTRSSNVTIAKIHFARIAENKTVHADLHDGNKFRRTASTQMAELDEKDNPVILPDLSTIVDLGGTALPVAQEEHLKLRQFMFAVYLSAGTADTHYLRHYYASQHNREEDTFDVTEDNIVETMLKEIQTKLDEIKEKSLSQKAINTDEASAALFSIITDTAINHDSGIIPATLLSLARSNQLIAEDFAGYKKDLAGTAYARKIPYLERTLMGIALQVAWEQRKSENASLWTADLWNYFKKNCLRNENGEPQLQYEKKFVYGVFGLTDAEAKFLDVAIPVATISTLPMLAIGAKALVKTGKILCNKIPELIQTYRHIENWKKIEGPQASLQSLFSRIQSAMPDRKSMANRFSELNTRSMNFHLQDKFSQAKMLPFFKRSLPGFIAGATTMYAVTQYQKRK